MKVLYSPDLQNFCCYNGVQKYSNFQFNRILAGNTLFSQEVYWIFYRLWHNNKHKSYRFMSNAQFGKHCRWLEYALLLDFFMPLVVLPANVTLDSSRAQGLALFICISRAFHFNGLVLLRTNERPRTLFTCEAFFRHC